MAEFSRQPLADLIGIVDPRVAGSPFLPLNEGGDRYSRRSATRIWTEDLPGALYQSEALLCPGYAVATFPVASLGTGRLVPNAELAGYVYLTNLGTWYRIQDLGQLARTYVPLIVRWGKGGAVMVMIDRGRWNAVRRQVDRSHSSLRRVRA